MLSFAYDAVQREYKGYWHMNFSIINGCGTCKIIFVVILFLSDACEFTKIAIKIAQKVSKQVLQKNQSIEKSREKIS